MPSAAALPERAWALPGEPVPVRLMSTIWAGPDGLHDDLRVPADVDQWLDAVGLDRAGKARLPGDAASIFERLGLDASRWLEAFEAIPRRRTTPRLGRPRLSFLRRLATPRRSPAPPPPTLAARL